jgi:hypothetical protein
MASNIKQLRDNLRAQWFDTFKNFLEGQGEEVLQTASNELAIPVVDAEGGEQFIVVTVKVPTGERGGDPYDGYAVAQDYAMKCEKRKAKAEENVRKDAERKAKKDK